MTSGVTRARSAIPNSCAGSACLDPAAQLQPPRAAGSRGSSPSPPPRPGRARGAGRAADSAIDAGSRPGRSAPRPAATDGTAAGRTGASARVLQRKPGGSGCCASSAYQRLVIAARATPSSRRSDPKGEPEREPAKLGRPSDRPSRARVAPRQRSPPGTHSTSPVGLVGRAGEDEEQVREPVEVGRGQRVHDLAVHLQRRPGGAFGPPDDRAGLVQQGRARGCRRAG